MRENDVTPDSISCDSYAPPRHTQERSQDFGIRCVFWLPRDAYTRIVVRALSYESVLSYIAISWPMGAFNPCPLVNARQLMHVVGLAVSFRTQSFPCRWLFPILTVLCVVAMLQVIGAFPPSTRTLQDVGNLTIVQLDRKDQGVYECVATNVVTSIITATLLIIQCNLSSHCYNTSCRLLSCRQLRSSPCCHGGSRCLVFAAASIMWNIPSHLSEKSAMTFVA